MENTKKLKRTLEVAKILVKYGFQDIMARARSTKWFPKDYEPVPGNGPESSTFTVYERIRMALEELGPTYVKLGQLFSNREDLIPLEMTEQLRKLEDRVTVEKCMVKERISEELQMDIGPYLRSIEETPLASASLAQVFKAQLIDGQWVVFKIKRSKIQEVIESDLLIMKDLAEFLVKHYDEMKNIGLVNMIETFEKSIKEEISYVNEMDNIERFGRNFLDHPIIKVHKVVRQFSNNNVICMEYIEGTKVTETRRLEQAGFDLKKIARVGFELYMEQVLEHGFFHADPHPGNILVTTEGKIAFIDFGIMGSLLPADRVYIEDFTTYFAKKDSIGLIGTIKKMALEHSIESETQLDRDIQEMFGKISGASLKNLDFFQLSSMLKSIFKKNGLLFPPYVYLLMKGIVLIEGIGRKLDPELNILELIDPLALKVAQKRMSPRYWINKGMKDFRHLKRTWSEIPEEMLVLLQKVKQEEFKLNHQLLGLSKLTKSLDRLVLALIISALSIGSSILVLADMPPKVYDIPVLGFLGFIISFIIGIWILISMMGKK